MNRLRGACRGGRLFLALVVGGATFGIATAVQADIPDSGVIHGCYHRAANPSLRIGALRVIDSSLGQSCYGDENALNWNQRGVTGPTGPTGPTGARGPTGPVSSFVRHGMVLSNGTLNDSSGFTVTHTGTGTYTITYPAGTFNFDATNFPVIQGTAFPAGGPIPLGWTVATLFGDGHLVYNVYTGSTDAFFDFTLVQHNGPNNPGTAPPTGNSITIHAS